VRHQPQLVEAKVQTLHIVYSLQHEKMTTKKREGGGEEMLFHLM